jgi:poly(3-hydroxybutyrate) depolymerase
MKALHAGLLTLFLSGCLHTSGMPPYGIQSGYVETKTAAGMEKISYDVLSYKNPAENRYPLLMLLHGTGEKAERYMEDWKKDALRRGMMVVVAQRERSYLNEEENLLGLYEVVEKVASEYPVDRDRIYLSGVSSGALISRWLMVRRPGMWRAVALIASEPFEDWMDKIDISKLPPILYVHGTKDEAYPIDKLLQKIAKLRKGGAKVHLMVAPEGGHEHFAEWNKPILDWVMEQ